MVLNHSLQRAAIVALVVALATPSAVASWISHGDREPSTSYDTDAFMWQGPPTTSANQVYFNAFGTHQAASHANPNSGTLNTRVQPFPIVEFDAMLGLWTDCNGDGYVGLAESAVLEYRSELLLESGACPAGLSIHNDGEWVYEYLIFAAEDPCVWASEEDRESGSGHPCEGAFGPSQIPGIIHVNNTRVWGDSQRPDLLSDDAPSSTCALTPIPRGTTSSSGLLLRYLDCSSGILGLTNTVSQTADPENTLNLYVEDRNNPHQSESILNFGLPVNLYGNPVEGQDGQTGLIEENSGDSAFTAWDCSAGAFYTQTDPTGGMLRGIGVKDETGLVPATLPDPTGDEGDAIELTDEDGFLVGHIDLADEDGTVFVVWTPGPAVHNPTGSYYDALNATFADSDGTGCDPAHSDGFVGNGAGTLDNPTSEGTAQSSGRQLTDWSFRYLDAWGGSLNAEILLGSDNPLGERAPADGGVTAGRFLSGVTWTSVPNLITITPNTGISRARLTNGDLSPAEPDYYAFYAAVDLALVSQAGWRIPTPGAAFVYGSEQCSVIGPGAGIQNGWTCDPTQWWKNAVGQDIDNRFQDGSSTDARVGDTYQLRDVDCFDGRLADGVHAGHLAPCV